MSEKKFGERAFSTDPQLSVGLISKKQYQKVSTKLDYLDEVNDNFDEQKELEKAREELKKKRLVKEKLMNQKKKANLSFLDEEEESLVKVPKKKKKQKKEGSKISLFSNKRFKESQDEKEEQVEYKGFGKDPSVNTSFLKDEEKEIEEEIHKKAEINRLIKKTLEIREQLIKIQYSYWDGSGIKKTIIVKKGETIEKNNNESLTGALADTFMMVKADYILPNHIHIMDFLTKQRLDGNCACKGKLQCQECIFPFSEITPSPEELSNTDILSDLEGVKEENRAKITLDQGPVMKIIERRVFEESKHIFPYYNWKAFEISQKP